MNIANVCRVCLSDKNKLYNVTNRNLSELFEKIAGTKVVSNNRPVILCYLCFAHLRHCSNFYEAARRSNALLTQFFHSGISLIQQSEESLYNYSTTPIEYITLKNDLEAPKRLEITVKEEPTKDEKHEEKESTPGKSEDDTNAFCDSNITSDSEDDVPLNSLKTGQILMKPRKKCRSKITIDAREVNLTKEQQIQNVLDRAKSLNYLNSPYKCDLCYKGFVTDTTLKNHLDKHSERSGAYSCSICRLRYRSARLLRAHARAAHRTLYACNKCAFVAHTANQAIDHEKWHQGHTFECQLCGMKFKNRTAYLTHVRKKHPTGHVCDVCGDSFMGSRGLLMHRNKTHYNERNTAAIEDASEPSKRFCSSCNIQFLTIEGWRKHVLNTKGQHLDKDQCKECPICSVPIPEHSSLEEHIKVHDDKGDKRRRPTANDRVACDECGTSYSTKAVLAAHIKWVHLGIKYNKDIVCEVCGKKCKSNATLKYHQRTHTGERPYPCTVCDKRFQFPEHLKLHSRTHSGERPYTCRHCNRSFAQRPALTRHYRTHTGVKPYSCQLCPKSFSQSNSLKIHVKSIHMKIPYKQQKKAKTMDNSNTNNLVLS